MYLVANTCFQSQKAATKENFLQVELKMKDLEGLVYKFTCLVDLSSFLKSSSEESEIHAASVPAGSA